MSQVRPFAKARLLPALAQARIARAYSARAYSAEALDSDAEVQRLRAEGHLVVALPHVRIVIYRYRKREEPATAPEAAETASVRKCGVREDTKHGPLSPTPFASVVDSSS